MQRPQLIFTSKLVAPVLRCSSLIRLRTGFVLTILTVSRWQSERSACVWGGVCSMWYVVLSN